MLSRLGELGLNFHGFHIYSGSQSLSAESIIEAQNKTIELGIRLAQSAPSPFPVLNIGGGFGIPLFPGDEHLDLAPIAENLARRMEELAGRIEGTRVAIELGRYLVGEAGVYLARIVDRKESHGQIFLVTDGGLHHQLAASGNFGTVVRRNYPAAIATKFGAEPEEQPQSIVGCLCTPLDRLADQAHLPRGEVGDLVAIFCAGAYGASASPAMFLGQGPAREVLV